MRHLLIASGLLLVLQLLPNAYADRAPGVDKRQQQQRGLIRDGFRDGSLTGRETLRLGAGQVRNERRQRRAGADGRISPRERIGLHRSLNRSRRAIHRQSGDGQTR